MRYRSVICNIAAVSLAIAVVSPEIRPQSGRGRPRIPAPPQPASPKPAINVPESTAVAKQEQAGNASRFVLRNGMTVLISEQHSYTYAAIVAYFRTGRLNEFEYGLIRVLQKALIAGDSQAPFKNARLIRAAGGALSVGSGRDYSYFCVLAPSKSLNDVLAAQSDLILHPVLNPETARRAAKAIEADYLSSCEDPAQYSTERVLAMAASDSEAASLNPNDLSSTASQDRLSGFYRSHYRADNLVVSVVGDIPTFDTLVQIERLYADFGAHGDAQTAELAPADQSRRTPEAAAAASRAGERKPPDRPVQNEIQGGSSRLLYLENRAKLSQAIVTAGYRVGGTDSDDWPALRVLTALLGQGRGSALESTLFFSQGVANNVQSDYLAGPDNGVVSIQIWLPPAAMDKAEASLFKEIDRLIKAQPEAGELARARAVAEIRLDQEVDTLAGTALMMAGHSAAAGGLPTSSSIVSRIRLVRPEDVQFVAAKYLSLSNAVIHEYEPLSAPPRSFDSASYARTVISWAPGLAQAATHVPKPPAIAPAKLSDKEKAARDQAEAEAQNVQPLPVKDFSTLNGPKVFVREDHTRPEVTIAILFQGGRLSETDANSGITDLMLRAVLYGTPRITKEQAAAALDKLGADVRLINEPDYFGFLLHCVSSNAGEALRFIRDLIEVPAFRDADIERARQEQLGAVWHARDSQSERAYVLMLEGVFPGHPYRIGPHGVESTIARLKGDDLRDWYSKTVKAQFPLAVIVGDTDGSALVSEGLAGEFKRRDLADTIKARIPGRPSNTEKVEQGACPATIQYLGFAGPRTEANDLAPLEVIHALLEGQPGPFDEGVYFKQGAGWAISIGFRAMTTAGLVYIRIETTPEDQGRARAAAVSKLQQLAGGSAGSDFEASRAVAVTSAMQRLTAQQNRALAYAEALYSKRDASSVDAFTDAVEKVSAADVRRVAAAYLKPGSFSIGMVQGSSGPKQTPPASPPSASR